MRWDELNRTMQGHRILAEDIEGLCERRRVKRDRAKWESQRTSGRQECMIGYGMIERMVDGVTGQE
jgi:hypothetical protein